MRDADVPLSETRRAAGPGGRPVAGRGPRAAARPRSGPRPTCGPARPRRPRSPSWPPRRPLRQDERIRDRELGVLDLLTKRGVTTRFPAEAQRRSWLGKFYYRPPGGESWADLVLRIRSFLADLDRGPGPGPATDRLARRGDPAVPLRAASSSTRTRVFEIARSGSVTNASVSRLVRPTANRAGGRPCTTTTSTWKPSAPSPPSTRERSMPPAEQVRPHPDTGRLAGLAAADAGRAQEQPGPGAGDRRRPQRARRGDAGRPGRAAGRAPAC